ncbi:hypothetical protein [Oenococcus oeni]|uniref:hypothetical protein n=1 Tax=Oenococcus oeni TaxID=1247 RepID=UPI0008F8C5D5|nr:hypothetical protein [Oenococcus oeni]OIM85596.1 hypothetical protein ATX99_02265 [Oenococcus oeni]
MTPTEKIEDNYKDYNFHFVCFPENLNKFHGYIDGIDIYINKNDPIELQAKTALHEITHAEYDCGCNLINHKTIRTGRAEIFAERIANREVKKYLS